MTANRILQLNAAITTTCAAAMLIARPYLYPLFGLASPMWLDVATVVFLAYAAALLLTARQRTVQRAALVAFTIGDGLCFAISLVVLLVFWGHLTPIARILIGVTAIVVDGFAMAQYRAARAAR